MNEAERKAYYGELYLMWNVLDESMRYIERYEHGMPKDKQLSYLIHNYLLFKKDLDAGKEIVRDYNNNKHNVVETTKSLFNQIVERNEVIKSEYAWNRYWTFVRNRIYVVDKEKR